MPVAPDDIVTDALWIASKYAKYYRNNYSERVFYEMKKLIWKKYFSNQTYNLGYKNSYLTLEQAEKDLSKINNLKVKKRIIKNFYEIKR